jgi:CubicO group peptidase (beta-lactamase class C family)
MPAADLARVSRIAFLTLTAALLAPADLRAQSAPAHLQGAIARIDAMAAAEHAKDRVASVTVGVVHGEHLVWTRSYGDADVERRIAATKDTVYRIGSVTKQFTGLMLLQLLQDGKVSPADPVERFFPDINKVGGRRAGVPPITLIQLATMTSGMGREPANLSRYLVGPVAKWEDVLLSALGETRYDHEPGTRYLYSNIGYATLGAALGRAAGMPYTSYVQQRILAPLGMTHTGFEPNAAMQPALAKGYAIRRDGDVTSEASEREHAGRGYKVPNGALYTTVGDLARFLAFELGEGPESVLKRDTLEEHQARVGSANGRLDSGYGVGFQLARRGEHVFLGHAGSVAGYTAQAWIHRPSRTGIIVLRNAAGGRFDLTGLTFRALTELASARAPETTTPRLR